MLYHVRFKNININKFGTIDNGDIGNNPTKRPVCIPPFFRLTSQFKFNIVLLGFSM